MMEAKVFTIFLELTAKFIDLILFSMEYKKILNKFLINKAYRKDHLSRIIDIRFF